jgi:DNA-binding transcriptional MerR regulator/methylmalonyl-CoA mutase cobalamin-binding subunit
MVRLKSKALELTYSVRTAAHLTGLSPELLRAWERRYGVVEPSRTPGGTRRYSAADLERLRLVKAAVDAGHRVGQVARLDLTELKRRAAIAEPRSAGYLDDILASLGSLEAASLQRQLSLQLSALGPTRFAREVATPLAHEIGERWANGQMGIAQEHLGSAALRSLLGSALQPTAVSLLGPRIVFATPTGERHELGLLMAALTALGAGANPIYLGAELPVEELLDAVEATDSAVLALSLVTGPANEAVRAIRDLRGRLASEVQLWLGGSGARQAELAQGMEHIESLEDLEQRVMLLGAASTP